MKYPIGIQDFARIIEDGYVYVDKTALSIVWWRKETFDFNGTNFTQGGALEETIEKFLTDQEEIYGRNPNSKNIGSRFIDLLKAAHQQTGRCTQALSHRGKLLVRNGYGERLEGDGVTWSDIIKI